MTSSDKIDKITLLAEQVKKDLEDDRNSPKSDWGDPNKYSESEQKPKKRYERDRRKNNST